MSPRKTKKTPALAKNQINVQKNADSPAPVIEKPKRKAPASDTYIIIDHPSANETVYPNHYAVRIGASNKGAVEISINNSEWLPCRYSDGYWWFDWQEFKSGKNKIVARLKNEKGRVLKKSAVCECEVK
jgi:hypothetical protein